jgi:hypothetical protein
MGLTVLFGSGNCLPPSKTRVLSWQAYIFSGGYRAVADNKIPIIQYRRFSSSKAKKSNAPSSVEATEQLQIIRSPLYNMEESLQARLKKAMLHPQWRLQSSCKL